MKLVPFHDNVFVEREEQEEQQTPGGLVLPKNAQDEPDTAIVVSVGPGRLLSNGTMVVPLVKCGDRVLIGRYAGTEVNWGREKRLVIPWSEILGIVEDDEVKKTGKKSKNTAKKNLLTK